MAALERAFRSLDRDGDCLVSPEEIAQAVEKLSGLQVDRAAVEATVARWDVAGDGLSFAELATALVGGEGAGQLRKWVVLATKEIGEPSVIASSALF
jgi:hypothetical protein